jgi:hypothetical protein
VSGQFQAHVALPPGKEPRYLLGLRDGLYAVEKDTVLASAMNRTPVPRLPVVAYDMSAGRPYK